MLRKKLKEGINPQPKRDGASAISFWFSEKVKLRSNFLSANA
jgi:hypothetical protein